MVSGIQFLGSRDVERQTIYFNKRRRIASETARDEQSNSPKAAICKQSLHGDGILVDN
jgi:hypothetical protein